MSVIVVLHDIGKHDANVCRVDGATIVGVPFCGLKEIRIKTMEI